jgi:hypothetical protein
LVCAPRPLFVTTGHSRSKNGVASLAYDPVFHAEMQLLKARGNDERAVLPHRLPDQARQ